jgi:hypothetical protein
MIRARAGIGFTFVRTVDVEADEVLVEFDGRDVTYGSLAAAKIAATRWIWSCGDRGGCRRPQRDDQTIENDDS